MPELVGIIPDSGGVLRLPKRLPPAIVNGQMMLMTGRRMNAKRRYAGAFTNPVVSAAELMDSARELSQIKSPTKGAPPCSRALKDLPLPPTSRLSVERRLQINAAVVF